MGRLAVTGLWTEEQDGDGVHLETLHGPLMEAASLEW